MVSDPDVTVISIPELVRSETGEAVNSKKEVISCKEGENIDSKSGEVVLSLKGDTKRVFVFFNAEGVVSSEGEFVLWTKEVAVLEAGGADEDSNEGEMDGSRRVEIVLWITEVGVVSKKEEVVSDKEGIVSRT